MLLPPLLRAAAFLRCPRRCAIPTKRLFAAQPLTLLSRTSLRAGFATKAPKKPSAAKTTHSAPETEAPPPPPRDAPSEANEMPILPPKSVGIWLMISSSLVLTIVVVGGVTRLTESGLSITEWNPITGMIPPLSANEWEIEFTKYKATPEFHLLNHSITIEEFKRIFYMEWAHRALGRIAGLVFVGPLAYFAFKRKISRSLAVKLSGIAALFAAQGLLGWYMVKSGLDQSLMETPGAVPRDWPLVLYAGMFSTAMSTIKEFKFAQGALWHALASPAMKRLHLQTRVLAGLVFLTALSGAFVAGLDAGLLYNEFPLMGGRIAPPSDELFNRDYCKSPDGSDLWWRNILENPTTVQFDHRVLAITTYFGIGWLWLRSRRRSIPAVTRRAITAAFGMANVQALLGITTLWYLVPIPLAASHQAGSVLLLSAMIHALLTFKKPGAAAQAWKQWKSKIPSGATTRK
ncbi:electron transfer protein 1 [Desarmillaria tabescens]|uniref:Electron transfer protein 1 n=1 Tax=Armillaria tabescens TaxID=1929756 RepID=A0AA39U6L5_ARMTA|nr:electron transfer protein 1 [Desarmillaria tabescens]KAK0468015.1 electron transfer protein 1 [Desarmillaria tabescens]